MPNKLNEFEFIQDRYTGELLNIKVSLDKLNHTTPSVVFTGKLDTTLHHLVYAKTIKEAFILFYNKVPKINAKQLNIN